METTAAQRKAAFDTITTISEMVRTLKEVPSGHLYASVMGLVSFQSYTTIIDMLKRAKLVKESNHLLTWIGPQFDVDGKKVM